jgi:hypothetical protein
VIGPRKFEYGNASWTGRHLRSARLIDISLEKLALLIVSQCLVQEI